MPDLLPFLCQAGSVYVRSQWQTCSESIKGIYATNKTTFIYSHLTVQRAVWVRCLIIHHQLLMSVNNDSSRHLLVLCSPFWHCDLPADCIQTSTRSHCTQRWLIFGDVTWWWASITQHFQSGSKIALPFRNAILWVNLFSSTGKIYP